MLRLLGLVMAKPSPTLELGGRSYPQEWAETGEDLVVRSSDGVRGRRKQKPRSSDSSQDGAALAKIHLPIMSKDKRSLSKACRLVKPRGLENRQRLIRRFDHNHRFDGTSAWGIDKRFAISHQRVIDLLKAGRLSPAMVAPLCDFSHRWGFFLPPRLDAPRDASDLVLLSGELP